MNIKDELLNKFENHFHEKSEIAIRCGGRFEILGNHTDHNHGECIAATCDMSIYSICKSTKDKVVTIFSEGYGEFSIDLSLLTKKEEEIGTSKALVRGVAKYLHDLNYKINGFKAYMKSTIFPGAGVSSSAAYELLIGEIFNQLFNNSKIDRLTLAKAGQFAERTYYGKNCGLLDQIGVSFGGMVHIDFKNIETPKVEKLTMEIKDHQFILVNTGGDHAHMSHLYSQIPLDMKEVSKILGVDFLRETSLISLEKNKSNMDNALYLRAKHFFIENERVQKAVHAIKNNDVITLKECINGSRTSSTNNLKNMMAEKYEGSPLEACDLVDKLTDHKGACKINGGGFAGSIVSLIPNEYVDQFVSTMKKKYGDTSVYFVNIDQIGVGKF